MLKEVSKLMIVSSLCMSLTSGYCAAAGVISGTMLVVIPYNGGIVVAEERLLHGAVKPAPAYKLIKIKAVGKNALFAVTGSASVCNNENRIVFDAQDVVSDFCKANKVMVARGALTKGLLDQLLLRIGTGLGQHAKLDEKTQPLYLYAFVRDETLSNVFLYEGILSEFPKAKIKSSYYRPIIGLQPSILGNGIGASFVEKTESWRNMMSLFERQSVSMAVAERAALNAISTGSKKMPGMIGDCVDCFVVSPVDGVVPLHSGIVVSETNERKGRKHD